MNALQKRLTRGSVAMVLGLSAALARRPMLNAVTGRVMRALATLTVRIKRIRPARDTADLGHQWQRAFPSAKQVPIRRIEDDTVYAEIHTPCPLRGSGDVHACHRMMEFDRAVLRAAGGQFVVLRSQAEPGRSYCEVAMRRAGATVADLPPAHLRAGPAPSASR